ncbi:MAG: hypothetical protein HY540_07900 [Deltaproteobacteria bacterium]|nr:hypothetical protein [Deltaproteobacteria bacterium]
MSDDSKAGLTAITRTAVYECTTLGGREKVNYPVPQPVTVYVKAKPENPEELRALLWAEAEKLKRTIGGCYNSRVDQIQLNSEEEALAATLRPVKKPSSGGGVANVLEIIHKAVQDFQKDKKQ